MVEANSLIHLYNQGNNRQQIFFSRENYIFFLKKVRKFLFPVCEILAYCLMPNHFHFLIYTTEESNKLKKIRDKNVHVFSENLRLMLSSYTRAINKQRNTSGSLFRQNTKMKDLSEVEKNHNSISNSNGYDFYCFFYIHQNPLVAGLVSNLEEWEFSSYPDYIGNRNGTLINKELAFKILDLEKEDIQRISSFLIKEKIGRDLEI